MEKPTFYEVSQFVIGLIALVGSGVLVVMGAIQPDALTLIVGSVLGFYFGRQSGESVKALAMTLWQAQPDVSPTPLTPERAEEWYENLPGLPVVDAGTAYADYIKRCNSFNQSYLSFDDWLARENQDKG